jgi:hypothetical protein
MSFFGYTKFLENENKDLKSRIESLEHRNHELVLALFTKASIVLPNPPKPQMHHITRGKDDKSAKCTCGWNCIQEDPAELQQKISDHYRNFTAPLGRASSWTSTRNSLESQGEKNEN